MIHNLLEGFKVVFDPNKNIADKCEVLVGLGNIQVDNSGLVLQHKTEKKNYESLSQYIFDLDLNNNTDSYDTLIIEDYSVDTILSIWLFLYKINNLNIPENINLWLDYASRWESGDTSTTGEAFESYGCLQNALALSRMNLNPKEVLLSSLLFLDTLIENEIDLSYVPKDLKNVTYTDAYRALQKEHDKYEKIVNNSEVLTLSIQEIDSTNVKKVSGIFIEMEMVTSIQKVFLRNDKQNSPTKDGFALMAVYNPEAIGTGNDIVISVDPQKHIQLQQLWTLLEKEENKLWEGIRPQNTPRPLCSYPEGNGPNEPWWDDMGKYTLIASPKKVGNQYGRRVSWETVKHIIKQLYAKGAQS